MEGGGDIRLEVVGIGSGVAAIGLGVIGGGLWSKEEEAKSEQGSGDLLHCRRMWPRVG